jgi:hypothetical protein
MQTLPSFLPRSRRVLSSQRCRQLLLLLLLLLLLPRSPERFNGADRTNPLLNLLSNLLNAPLTASLFFEWFPYVCPEPILVK